MNDKNSIERLQAWYEFYCNGEWEHETYIEITTIDNPGWSVSIPLGGTSLEGKNFDLKSHNYDDDIDWWTCRVEGGRFLGYGGAQNLENILHVFLDWMEESE